MSTPKQPNVPAASDKTERLPGDTRHAGATASDEASEFQMLETLASESSLPPAAGGAAPSSVADGSSRTEADRLSADSLQNFGTLAPGGPSEDPFATRVVGPAEETDAPTHRGAPTGQPPPSQRPTQPAAGPLSRPPQPAAPPSFSIAGYEILGELGHGGMGVVYKALQTGLNRIVALKMVLAGPMARSVDRARFLIEAEAIGKLQHPHIVQIYEVGDHQGQPFFSLEFVDGGSLSGKLDGTPATAVEAAQLVEKLGRAMHYAHQCGIIHRDLKPANVLLMKDGTPKITDFGLAKFVAAGDSGQTNTGAVLGTPSYMAPEQAGGKTRHADARTDVYSLGAILYELLTGRPPFRGTTVMDTLHQVLAVEPVPPSRLQLKLPRDLETICLKSLEKEPGRRYQSAGEMADDLTRFLQHTPIRARPVGAVERAVKWARRRPAVAGLLALLALLLAGSAAGGWIAALELGRRNDAIEKEKNRAVLAEGEARDNEEQAKASELRALAATKLAKESEAETLKANGDLKVAYGKLNTEQQETSRQRDRAARNFQHALGAVDRMLSQVAAVELADVPQMEGVRKQLLDQALNYCVLFLQEGQGNDPALRLETARAHRRSADILEMLGKHAEAEKSYGQALALLDELQKEGQNGPETLRELGAVEHNLGVLFKKNTRYREAEKAFRQALRLRTELTEKAPADADLRREVEGTRFQLAALLARLGKKDNEAEQAYLQALGQQKQLEEKYQDKPQFKRELARTYYSLGNLYEAGGRPNAREVYDRALALLDELHKGAQHVAGYRWDLARTYNNLAKLQDTPARQKDFLNKALALFASLAQDFPQVPDYRQELAAVYRNYGRVLFTSGDPDEGEKALREGLRQQEQLAREFPSIPHYRQKVAYAKVDLGILLARKKQGPEAEKLYREALAEQTKLDEAYANVPEYRTALGETWKYLGLLYYDRGLPGGDKVADKAALTEARRCLQEAAACLRPVVEAGSPQRNSREALRDSLNYLSRTCWALEDHAAAAVAADELPKAVSEPDEHLRAAQMLVLCMKVAESDKRLNDLARAETLESYARKAVAHLGDAFKKGYKKTDELKAPGYEPLRKRDDFKKLQKDLEQKAKTDIG